MVSRFGNKNFFAAHYEWIAVGVAALALVGGAAMYVLALGDDPDAAAAQEAAGVARMKPDETGVKPVDLSTLRAATKVTLAPVRLVEFDEKVRSFLASERRVLCTKCKKAISGDIREFPKCPFCGEPQQEEKKVVLDGDADGLPDEWEKRYGLNVNDASDANADLDGDGFTNLEEFVAKTDPTDKNDHPDYLDSLKIVLPLKETKMPFAFRKATQIPGGWRCEFFDPSRKDNYGRMGATLTATIGEPIADTGFTLKKYEVKSEKREKKGMKGMFIAVDVSEATVERQRDGKLITLVVQSGKNLKYKPVDVQASLAYERGTVQNFEVTPGSELELNGTKYRVVDIQPAGKGAKLVIETMLTGKRRTIEALEP